MDKCKKCKRRKHRIACLKCEQEADNHYPIVKPQIIKPVIKNIPFEELSDKEKAAVMLSTWGEMAQYRIAKILKISPNTVTSLIAKGLGKLRGKNRG